MFFNPPLEDRNPELLIHSHVVRPSVKDVLKEKRIPFRQFLEGVEDVYLVDASSRPKSAYGGSDKYSVFSIGNAVPQERKAKHDFNVYDKISRKKRLEIMEL